MGIKSITDHANMFFPDLPQGDAEFYTKALDRGPVYYLPKTFSIDCIKTDDLRSLVKLECTCDFCGPLKTRCPACRVWSWVINPVFMRMQYEEVEDE
jgi:hypothetical protein